MTKLIAALFGLVVLAGMAPAIADIFAASPFCSRPYRNAYGYDRSDVERYHSCLKQFIEDQERQAKNHLDAADQAGQEWKRFVREANAGM